MTKGYKATLADMTCRGFKYELGKTYRTQDKIELCERGFHFCTLPEQVYNFYDRDDTRLFEVEAGGEIIESDEKCVCSEITLVREITGRERTLAVYGDGYGNGYGDGYGNGYGYGYGYGDGYGNGYGDGYGDGYGYGDGSRNMQKVFNLTEVEK